MSTLAPHSPAGPEPPSWFVVILKRLFHIETRLTRVEKEVVNLKQAVERQRTKPMVIAAWAAVVVTVLLSIYGGGWALYTALRAEIQDVREEIQDVRVEVREGEAMLRGEIQGLRVEVREGEAMLRVAIREGDAMLRDEIQAGFAALRAEFNEEIRELDRRVDRLDVRVALAEQRAGLTPTSSAEAVGERTDVDSRLERQQFRLANIQLRLDALQGQLGQVPPPRDAAEAQRRLAETPHDEANVWVDQLLDRIDLVEGALAP